MQLVIGEEKAHFDAYLQKAHILLRDFQEGAPPVPEELQCMHRVCRSVTQSLGYLQKAEGGSSYRLRESVRRLYKKLPN